MALAFAFLGFVDDYIKVVKKRNLGLTAGQKMVMQILIAAIYLIILYLAGDTSTVLRIPFIGSLDLGLFYYPVALFILIVGTVNAVNLTDGIDGLAGSVTFIASCYPSMKCSFLRWLSPVRCWVFWFGISIRQRCLWAIRDLCF